MNIIIVDDEKLIRQGLTFLLAQMGTNDAVIGQCKNGREALELCLREEIAVDVVITDVRMPEMDGLELITELKKQRPHIQTLVMSGYDEFNYVRKALREGAHDYLLKPVDKLEVKSVLDRIRQQKVKDVPSAPLHTQAVVEDSLLNGLITKEPGKMNDAKRFIFEKFGASNEENSFLMAGIQIDETPEHALKNTDRQLFQYFIRKMSEELLFIDAPQSGTVFQGGDGKVLFLFFLDKGSRESAAVHQKLKDLLALIQQHIRYPVTMGLSLAQENISDMSIMSAQLDEVFRARLVMGTGQLLSYDKIQHLHGGEDMPKDLMKPVLIAFETADEDAMIKAVTSFFTRLGKLDVRAELTMDVIMRMLMRLASILQERGIDIAQAGLTDGLSMSRELEKCSTWALLVNYVTETVLGYRHLLQRHKLESKPPYILHAIEYMRIHFASNITLNEVADTVGLYPTYLSEQFKQHTGQTFIDYITQVRVDRAKELLRKSDLPAFTICEEVGYATAAHFSKVFKKWVGCTPTEYRERYQHQLVQ